MEHHHTTFGTRHQVWSHNVLATSLQKETDNKTLYISYMHKPEMLEQNMYNCSILPMRCASFASNSSYYDHILVLMKNTFLFTTFDHSNVHNITLIFINQVLHISLTEVQLLTHIYTTNLLVIIIWGESFPLHTCHVEHICVWQSSFEGGQFLLQNITQNDAIRRYDKQNNSTCISYKICRGVCALLCCGYINRA